MMKLIAKSIFVFLLAFNFSLASAQSFFRKTDRQVPDEQLMPRVNFPSKYQLFETSFKTINEYLLSAPLESETITTHFSLELPDADGELTSYAVFKSPIMEPELEAEFPGLYSYIGYNTKDPTNNIRFTVSYIHGIHLMGYNGKGDVYYMDTYSHDLNTYIFYNRKHIEDSREPFECLTESHSHEATSISFSPVTFSQDAKFRQYRMAMACTVEYAAFHVNNAPPGTPVSTEAQKKAVVQSAMNVTLARLNTVYERDLSIRLIFIGNNSSLIFINSDNFSNDNVNTLINQSQSTIHSLIGAANYDIGHTVSTGAGGLAGMGVVCYQNYKAQGVTGSSAPVGDPFDIDYVAHEVGHQFGADHTFNGNTGACFGNIGNVSAEPGSGSTIMAYAGICAGQNVQNHSDPYFHYYSIQQIYTFISQEATCATILSTANATPTANGGGSYTIPKSTPFKLTGTATDANNPLQSLTYTWEQLDKQITTYPLTGNSTGGPNFRSLPPTSNNYRYFPALSTVLAGTSTLTQAPGSTWERLSNVARLMQFGFTVRDNNALTGGQTKRDVVNINVANVGPFVLTYPDNLTTSEDIEWMVGSTQTITWNVAGTTANGINTSHVDILYTADEGQTFTTLLANTPNDGNQQIQVPILPANTEIRIMVQPVGNVYYAISKRVKLVNMVSVDEFQFEAFKLYPNPSKDLVTFSFVPENSSEIIYQLFDINGRLLLEKTIENTLQIEETFSVAPFAAGTYMLKIKNGNRKMFHKIIKN